MFDKEEKILNSFQEYLDEVRKQRVMPLENGIPYKGKLKFIREGFTSITKTPTINFGYDINGIEAIDTYVLDMDNPKYIKFTLNRLSDTLKLYGENFEEFTDTKTVVETYQHLIGTEATIQQYLYKGHCKYEILNTEKTDLNI